jgi:fatty-acyl-CoA synthase
MKVQIKKTPTTNGLSKRCGDFETLVAALDYAAQGTTGINFYERGQLKTSLTYTELRTQAVKLAKKLNSLNVERGSRMAVFAETDPYFHIFFFACQYAGLIPVPIPVQFRLGSKNENILHARSLIKKSGATLAVATESSLNLLMDAVDGLKLEAFGSVNFFQNLPENVSRLKPLEPEETAYLQYTSGSTRKPCGVEITQKAVMSNLEAITKYGLEVNQSDRCVSWLPFYHDMGLVGFVLGPIASQLSVDYFSPQDFVMRPTSWLTLISSNKATISFAPPLGYALCAKRLKSQNLTGCNLKCWRVAGVGADTIRFEPLHQFAELLKPVQFNKNAFLACYGLAECSLAVSFAPLGKGLDIDHCDRRLLAENGIASPVDSDTEQKVSFVKCGRPLPNLEIQVRDKDGKRLKERHVGALHIKGPSLMKGYIDNPEETEKTLFEDGWLNTGDSAYIKNGEIVIVGRNKDMMVINGRNIWPQDLESIVTQNPEIMANDAIAFSVFDSKGNEIPVIEIQCAENVLKSCEDLIKKIKSEIYYEMGLRCYLELVPLHTIPHTTSGKPSRSKAKKQFLERHNNFYSGYDDLKQDQFNVCR